MAVKKKKPEKKLSVAVEVPKSVLSLNCFKYRELQWCPVWEKGMNCSRLVTTNSTWLQYWCKQLTELQNLNGG